MTYLEIWVTTPAAKALGWTLFYSLFEGAMVALLLALVLWTVRSARIRYAAACLAMIAMLAAFGFTFGSVLSQERAHRGGFAAALRIPPAADELEGSMRGIRGRLSLTATDVLPWLAPFWIAGVLLFYVRNLTGWLAARRLCRTGVCEAPGVWRERLDVLRARLRLSRPVSLLESGLSSVPVAVGYMRPTILLPAGLLTGLPAGQIEAILLHELGHIRRSDYLVNLLQALVEGLLFYHPAVWWISNVIRAERENCCDDLVVQSHGDAREYAAALMALETNRAAVPVMAATGGTLVKRVRRLLVPDERPRAGAIPVITAMLLTLVAAVALTAWQSQRPVEPAPPGPYLRWMNEDVAYIITDDERRAFKDLKTDEEREHFIRQFWDRRNASPGSRENPVRQEHYRRIAFANEHFGTDKIEGWKTDRGRIYIMYGPPDQIESHRSGGAYTRPPEQGGGVISAYPFEQWFYRLIQNVGTNVIMDFVDRDGSGEYRMTTDPHAKEARPLPFAPVPDANTKSAGAIVVAADNGSATLSIPLAAYGDHRLYVYARLITSARRVVQIFEEPIAGGGGVYTKMVAVQPGRYEWFAAVRDVTTGTLYADTLTFEVK